MMKKMKNTLMTDIKKAAMRNKYIAHAMLFANKHRLITMAIGLILVIIIAIAITPTRSKESFCRVLNENKKQLLSDSSQQKRLEIFKSLERVAPSEMAQDMQQIVKGYQTAFDKPENAIAAEFGIMGETNRFNAYMNKECSEKS
jgi:hypothetical protein